MNQQTIHQGDAMTWLESLSDGIADMMFADPPYSSGGLHAASRTGSTGRKYLNSSGANRLPDFAGDTLDQRSWTRWMIMWLTEARRVTKDGGLACVFTDWRQLPSTTDALQMAGWIWRGIVVWDKTQACRPQLGRFRNQAEYVVWGTKGDRPMVGAVAPGVITSASPRGRIHQTEKPVDMLDKILSLVPAGGVVIDPFAGSGSAGVAALRRGLRYQGCELVSEIHQAATARLSAA